jgi:hypothetical protein
VTGTPKDPASHLSLFLQLGLELRERDLAELKVCRDESSCRQVRMFC